VYEQITVPRSTPVVTPEQLAAFGHFDCPEATYGSPPVANPEYTLIELFIEAATDHVEIMAATAMITEQIVLTFDMWPDAVDPRVYYDYLLYSFDWIPAWWMGWVSKESIEVVRRPMQVNNDGSPPVAPVITYNDPNGVLQTLDPALYTAGYNKITLNVGCHWPPTDRRQDCIQINYTVGYGDNPADVPAQLQLATLFLANHFYDNRAVIAVEKTSEIAMTLKAILRPFMSYRIPK
jgi:hypothetical protein